MKKKSFIFILFILIILLNIFSIVYAETNSDSLSDIMIDTERTAFNQNFTKYEGSQKGSTIKTLLQEVKYFNISEDNLSQDSSRKIKVNINEADIVSTSTYTVSFKYNSENYINEIIVQQNNTSSTDDTSNPTSTTFDNKSSTPSNNLINSTSKNTTSNSQDKTKTPLPKTGLSNLYIPLFFIGIFTTVIFLLLFKSIKI